MWECQLKKTTVSVNILSNANTAFGVTAPIWCSQQQTHNTGRVLKGHAEGEVGGHALRE